MLNSLRIQRDMVALEAFSSTDLASFMRDMIPNISKQLTGFVNGFAPEAKPIPLTSAQADFLKEISKHKYLDLAPLAAFVPEGMEVTYYDYGLRLDVSVDHTKQIIDKVLAPYSTYLSQLISNADQKFNTASLDGLFSELEQARKNSNASLGSCFGKGSTRTEVKYGDVVSRNNDWTAVFNNAEHMSKEINRVDRKALNKKIRECSDLLEIIVSKIKRNEFEGVAPQVVKNLSDGAYQVARELEFYSVTYYRVLAYLESINRTMQHVTQVFKH